MVRRVSILIAALAVTFAVQQVHADIMPQGIFHLRNHSDGNVRPPLYGLRLDGLGGFPQNDGIWTFDFDDASSNMKISFDGTSVHIYGKAFGGKDIGNAYDPATTAVWDVDFTYSVVTTANGDIRAVTGDATNNGSITNQTTNETIGLWDTGFDQSGYTFRIDTGHRGEQGFSGWGWLNHHDPNTHVYSSDWLFAIDPTPIPAPGAALLAALGLATVYRFRARLSPVRA